MGKIKRCVSTYSFNEELMSKRLTVEECVAKVHEFGAEGIEVLGDQIFPGYPTLSDTTQRQWLDWMEKYQLDPVIHDMFLDIRINHNRRMSLDEMTDSLVRDIIYARKLGCKLLRCIAITPVEVIEKAAPYAEKFGVKLGMEIHSPWNFESEYIKRFMEVILRLKSEFLGLIPDCSIFSKKVPRVAVDKALRKGANQKIIDYLCGILESGEGFGKNSNSYETLGIYVKNLHEEIRRMGGNQADIEFAMMAIGYTWLDPECMTEYMPYILHIHAKFCEMLDDEKEYSIPYERVIDVLKKGAYNGYLSSEYEGGMFMQDLNEPVDGVEQVRRQQAMFKKLIP